MFIKRFIMYKKTAANRFQKLLEDVDSQIENFIDYEREAYEDSMRGDFNGFITDFMECTMYHLSKLQQSFKECLDKQYENDSYKEDE